jgi:hypothetical protein
MPQFGSGRWRRILVFGLLIINIFACGSDFAQHAKKRGKKKAEAEGSASATATPEENSRVPLPIGHDAKGLVFPDIDENGHLRGRFVAGVARRVDQDHMEFRDLRILTFTDDNRPDLEVTMIDSVLDMNTRVLSSEQRTVVKRSDFEIVGDKGRFDTAARQGTVTGNVKMVITDAADFSPQKAP